MPWRCPACSIQIHHLENESAPRVGVNYRCHVCRLELTFDPVSQKLVLLPLPDGYENPEKGTKPSQ